MSARIKSTTNPTTLPPGSQLFPSLLNLPTPPIMPLRHLTQLPLPMLSRRRQALRSNTAIDNPRFALPTSIGRIIVRIGVSGPWQGAKKGDAGPSETFCLGL